LEAKSQLPSRKNGIDHALVGHRVAAPVPVAEADHPHRNRIRYPVGRTVGVGKSPGLGRDRHSLRGQDVADVVEKVVPEERLRRGAIAGVGVGVTVVVERPGGGAAALFPCRAVEEIGVQWRLPQAVVGGHVAQPGDEGRAAQSVIRAESETEVAFEQLEMRHGHVRGVDSGLNPVWLTTVRLQVEQIQLIASIA